MVSCHWPNGNGTWRTGRTVWQQSEGASNRATKAMLDNVRAQTNLEIGTPRRGLGGLHKKSQQPGFFLSHGGLGRSENKDFLRRISQERWQGTVGDSRVTGKAKGTEDKLGGGGFRNQGGRRGRRGGAARGGTRSKDCLPRHTTPDQGAATGGKA